MRKAELVRLIAEEPLGIGVSELLHGHRVNLCNIGRFAVIIRNGLAAHGHVARKRVAQFVRQHLHIENRVVEAGEHERRFQAGLARLVLQIHQLVVDHEIDEFSRFRADLVVHLLRSLDHEGVVARRLGVAVREHQLFVVAHDVVEAETLCLCVIKLLAQRDKECAHLLAEGSYLLFTVVCAALLQIADRDVVLVAEIFAHLIADFDQFVPNFLQTRLIGLIELGIRLDGGGTHRAVRMLKVFLHTVEVQRLAVERNFRRGHDLLIFVGQPAFLLAQRNVGLTEQLFLQIHGNKILLAELLLDIRAEGAGGNRLAERDLCAAERGQRVLQILNFRFIKLVARVERMPDVRDGILCEQLAGFAVDLKHQRAQRGVVLCMLDGSFPLGKLCAARFQIRTFVFQC